MYAVGTILNKTNRDDNQPLNILTIPTHERYESTLAKTGHNFYAFHGQGLKTWDKNYAEVPKNYTLLDGSRGIQQIPYWMNFDCVLSQSKSHTQYTKQFSALYGIPIICIEHTAPMPNMPKLHLQQIKQQSQGDINLFITKWSAGEWGFEIDNKTSFVINHGMDTEVFKPFDAVLQKHILTVANEYPQRSSVLGFDIYQRITRDLPVFPVGNSTGFSKPASSVEQLVQFYNQSQVFLNTSTVSPIPMSVLEAMACGCAVVTTATGDIPNIIEHGVNGLISNDETKLREYLVKCLNDPTLCSRLGHNARQTVLEKYNIQQFLDSWNHIFDLVRNETNVTIRKLHS